MPPEKPGAGAVPRPGYDRLRWTIRVAGTLLMFGGTIYLGKVAAALLSGSLVSRRPTDNLMILVVSLVELGLGIFVLRTGLNMLRSVDASAIRHFSFVFALIYTFILMQVLPLSGLFFWHPVLTYLLLGLYLGLSYWVLNRILLVLLLPTEKR